MPKREEDKPVSLHPLSFEEAIRRLLRTPPVNPAKRKKLKKKRQGAAKSR